MSNKKRIEMSMFINSKGRIECNRLCKACVYDCKQSYRAIIIDCPKYTPPQRSPEVDRFKKISENWTFSLDKSFIRIAS